MIENIRDHCFICKNNLLQAWISFTYQIRKTNEILFFLHLGTLIPGSRIYAQFELDALQRSRQMIIYSCATLKAIWTPKIIFIKKRIFFTTKIYLVSLWYNEPKNLLFCLLGKYLYHYIHYLFHDPRHWNYLFRSMYIMWRRSQARKIAQCPIGYQQEEQ